MAPFSGLPKKRAKIAIAAATVGGNELVAAVAGRKIRVVHIYLEFSAAANVVFESGTSGPDLSGSLSKAANGKIHDQYPEGFMETDSGESLNLRSDAAAAIGGWIVYETPE